VNFFQFLVIKTLDPDRYSPKMLDPDPYQMNTDPKPCMVPVPVYKIMNGVGEVKSEQWFKMADNDRATWRTDLLNIRIQVARLETRRNFSPTECQKHGTKCHETIGKLAQLRPLKRPTKTIRGRWWPSHDARDATEKGYDQRQSLRGSSGTMKTQPTSASTVNKYRMSLFIIGYLNNE
jgi:hypothetical protein